MLIEKHKFEIFADYFQFYLCDEESKDDSSNVWTEQTHKDMLAVLPKEIVIGTARNMDVPVEIEIHSEEPKENFDLWDHITECSFSVPSGKIVVAGCTDFIDEAVRLEVSSDDYRARIFYGKLEALSEDGLEGDDHYKIFLWRGEKIPTRVIKRRIMDSR